MGFYSMGSNGIFFNGVNRTQWDSIQWDPMGFFQCEQWDLSIGPNGVLALWIGLSRIDPPYPTACRKRRLKGVGGRICTPAAVKLSHRQKTRTKRRKTNIRSAGVPPTLPLVAERREG